MNELDHTKSTLTEALGISKAREDELRKWLDREIRTRQFVSEILEKIANAELTMVEKLWLAYTVGDISAVFTIGQFIPFTGSMKPFGE